MACLEEQGFYNISEKEKEQRIHTRWQKEEIFFGDYIVSFRSKNLPCVDAMS